VAGYELPLPFAFVPDFCKLDSELAFCISDDSYFRYFPELLSCRFTILATSKNLPVLNFRTTF